MMKKFAKSLSASALLLTMLLVSLTSSSALAQEPITAGVLPQPASSPASKKVEDKEALLNLQLLATKRALAQSNYTNLMKQLQEMQNQYTSISNDLAAQIDALYKKMNLDPKKFDINFETGEISPLPDKK